MTDKLPEPDTIASKIGRGIAAGAHAVMAPREATLFLRYRDRTIVGGHRYLQNLQLARRVAGIEGDVVECGTWKGGMIAGIADLLRQPARRYHLFDSFQGMPPTTELDGEEAQAFEGDMTSADFRLLIATEEEARDALGRVPGGVRYEIHAGWFADTVPPYAATGPEIALLRLDGDWYDSTMTCLEHLYPLVGRGGLVIIDDYGTWEGCARAMHDYLSRTSAPEFIDHHGEVAFITKR